MHLNFSDINLGYFEFIQNRIRKLLPGDRLIPTDEGCTNLKNELVLKYSKHFLATLNDLKQKEYKLSVATINFVLYWKDPEKETEFLIVLPEICLENIGVR